MDLNYGKRKYLQRIANDADEVEIKALQLGSATIDSGIEDEHIVGAMDDFLNNDNEPDWVKKDIANDLATSDIYNELNKRKVILGDIYPFELDGNAIVPKVDRELITYIFCLITSYQKNITCKPFTELPRTFELLAAQYSQAHLGVFAQSLHTGWPRQPGSTTTFKALANEIQEQTGEWFWQTEFGLDDSDSNHIKDNGIDFIAWLQAPDNRPGKLFIVGQCACGNDWSIKFSDVNLSKLDMWFHPVSWVPPVKAFCLPYALVAGYLYDASRQAGLVYDRFRLAMLSINAESILPDEIIESMQRCIKLVLEN